MMRSLRLDLVIAVTAVMMLAAAGCGTAGKARGNRASFNVGKQEPIPFVQKGDYPDRLGLVLQSVLVAHRFSHPWVAARGENSSIWFVAERFESGQRFDRLYMH